MVRAPMSAQIGASRRAGDQQRGHDRARLLHGASTLAAPVKDSAPSWRVSEPNCSEITAPNGIATSAVGRIVTLAMNQDCSMNSRNWNGRWKNPRMTSSDEGEEVPGFAQHPDTGNRPWWPRSSCVFLREFAAP